MKLRISLFIICLLTSVALAQQPLKNIDVFELEWIANPKASPKEGGGVVFQRRGFDIMTDRTTSRLWLWRDGKLSKLTDRDENESNAAWSPDGSRIAFTSRSSQGTEIFVYDLPSDKVSRISALDQSPGGLSWSPDGTQIAFSMFVPAAPKKLVSPPKKPAGARWADPVRVTMRFKYEADGSGYLKPGFRHYFIISAEGGTERQVTSGDFNFSGTPQWTRDGKGLIFSSNLNEEWEYDFRNSEVYHLDLETSNIITLTDRNGPDRSPVVSPNGKKILYLGYDDRVQTYQLTHVYEMNLDGSAKRKIDLKLDRNPSNLQWAADGRGFYFMYDDKGDTKIGHYDLNKRKVSMKAEHVGGTSFGRPYGGGSYSVTPNGNLVYARTSPAFPASLAIMSPNGEERIVTAFNDDFLAYRDLGQVEEVWYKSSFDGRDIQGWIVKPPYFDPNKDYPLLVENHGGPISNYGPRFSLEMQLYAADGYVVFYPNPRGSTSYGEAFGNLLYHNYPGNDYDDVMSGVDAMIGKGYISEDSLFVTGGSAGGIMTAWMIGKNNRFRAAAVVKPIMNWISKTLIADNYYGYANSRFPGQPWESVETYMKFSPISLVGNVQTPTLVMVGMEDRRTPPAEAKQLYGALKIRKIPTALVELPGASHGIANRPSQLIAKVDNILAWFRRYRK